MGAATSRDTTKDLLARAEKKEWHDLNPQTRVVHHVENRKGKEKEDIGEKRKRGEDGGEAGERPGFFKTKSRPIIYWKPASAEQQKRNERYLNLKAVKRAVCTNFQNTGRCRFGD